MTNLEMFAFPFFETMDLINFINKYNIKKYSVIYFPSRGIKYPKKQVLIIEELTVKFAMSRDYQFNYEQGKAQLFKDKEELEENKYSLFNRYDIPWIGMKLNFHDEYIYISSDIEEPNKIIYFKAC